MIELLNHLSPLRCEIPLLLRAYLTVARWITWVHAESKFTANAHSTPNISSVEGQTDEDDACASPTQRQSCKKSDSALVASSFRASSSSYAPVHTLKIRWDWLIDWHCHVWTPLGEPKRTGMSKLDGNGEKIHAGWLYFDGSYDLYWLSIAMDANLDIQDRCCWAILPRTC